LVAVRQLNINGVTLHLYRYAWAERALKCGYPERFSGKALFKLEFVVGPGHVRHSNKSDEWWQHFL
jgi:putative salt-induced outer membrane protein YdiY